MSAFFIGHPKETDLALFAGGELGPLSRWRIERHIESCAECEALVADYFHLTEELQPLAEIPDLNWDAMARGIERRLAADETVEQVRPRVPAIAWAAGLAAVAVISGVVVMRQQPSASPAKEMVAMESAAVPQETASQDAAAAFAEMDRTKESRQAAPSPAPEPVVAAEQDLSAAKAKAMEPARLAGEQKRERIEEAEAPVEMALADEMAPPPPAAPSSLQMLRSAPRASAPAAVGGALGGFGGGFAGGRATVAADAAGQGTFDIQPLFDPASDVRIASDGWISVRSISAEGRVTITDVYAP